MGLSRRRQRKAELQNPDQISSLWITARKQSWWTHDFKWYLDTARYQPEAQQRRKLKKRRCETQCHIPKIVTTKWIGRRRDNPETLLCLQYPRLGLWSCKKGSIFYVILLAIRTYMICSVRQCCHCNIWKVFCWYPGLWASVQILVSSNEKRNTTTKMLTDLGDALIPRLWKRKLTWSAREMMVPPNEMILDLQPNSLLLQQIPPERQRPEVSDNCDMISCRDRACTHSISWLLDGVTRLLWLCRDDAQTTMHWTWHVDFGIFELYFWTHSKAQIQNAGWNSAGGVPFEHASLHLLVRIPYQLFPDIILPTSRRSWFPVSEVWGQRLLDFWTH